MLGTGDKVLSQNGFLCQSTGYVEESQISSENFGGTATAGGGGQSRRIFLSAASFPCLQVATVELKGAWGHMNQERNVFARQRG